MRKWLLIGAAGAAVGYGAVYLALDRAPAPEPEAQQPAVAAVPTEPVVLSDVVEVTNLDPLLAPRPAAPAGVPFDAPGPIDPPAPAAAPPIPAAGE